MTWWSGRTGQESPRCLVQVLNDMLPRSVFVNADWIAADRWPDDAENHAHEAAAMAEATRNALIAEGRQFIAETVFSHPSTFQLIEHAQEAGYFVALHVLMVPEDLAVARVASRVAHGGHTVPEQKIRTCDKRLWPLVASAATMTQSATFWDNSTIDAPHNVAEMTQGQLLAKLKAPAWTPMPLIELGQTTSVSSRCEAHRRVGLTSFEHRRPGFEHFEALIDNRPHKTSGSCNHQRSSPEPVVMTG